jgi:hypothetical protein
MIERYSKEWFDELKTRHPFPSHYNGGANEWSVTYDAGPSKERWDTWAKLVKKYRRRNYTRGRRKVLIGFVSIPQFVALTDMTDWALRYFLYQNRRQVRSCWRNSTKFYCKEDVVKLLREEHGGMSHRTLRREFD